jgi:hypothetical protein
VTDHLLVLLVCMAVIVVLAILIYVVSRSQLAALSTICELRMTLQQIFDSTKTIDQLLHAQRRVLNDAHKRITTVTKGIEKRPS